MSAENGKVCCNCRHCIRERDEKTLYTYCHCEVDGGFLPYVDVMGFWCRKWAKKKDGKNETD
jgi:hypothetical protein